MILGAKKAEDSILREEIGPVANLFLQLLFGNKVINEVDLPKIVATFGK